MRDHSINVVEELKPYVPPLVIRRLARSKVDSTQAAAERYSAAVLFVDITGYSALAEGLSHKRFEGVEELAAFLNQGFELLIQIVEEYGGEVTKFAGDALVAIWPVPQSMARVGIAARQRLSDHILLAAQCAFSIHERVTASLRSSDGESLLRLGIAAGDVYVVHLGGVFDRWEFLLSGEPMVQMSRAKDLALAGEVVIDPAAWSLIQDRCSAELNDANFANIKSVDSDVQRAEARKLVVHDSMAQHLRGYVPAAITRRLEAGYGAWLSEIRHLSIIFVKLPGYGTSITHPYATTVPEAQAVMRAMQRALYRFEGSINKFNVDDKGITLVAAMGLPPLAHEDDPSRAVLAALELQKVLDILDRPCAIGVSTGWTFCGPIGDQNRREYTIVGNSVNRAARLMQIAERRRSEAGLPSYVLCDEETYVDIGEEERDVPAQARSIVFERLTGVVLKGRKDAVTAYRPHLQRKVSVHPASYYRSRAFFVGRKVERRALKNYLRTLTQEDNYSATVIIEGEQGVGKSALIGEILRDASAYDIRTLTGAGEVSSQSKAYHAWRPIFEQIFRIDLRYDDIGSQRRKVMRKLPALPGEKGYPALALKLTPLLN
ncbi:MAG: adenylate/guanylate cyclase domain-containing protein, partial [Candidatus Promineifilaceae bacterium]